MTNLFQRFPTNRLRLAIVLVAVAILVAIGLTVGRTHMSKAFNKIIDELVAERTKDIISSYEAEKRQFQLQVSDLNKKLSEYDKKLKETQKRLQKSQDEVARLASENAQLASQISAIQKPQSTSELIRRLKDLDYEAIIVDR